MPALRKYPEELRVRAIRFTVEARTDPADRAGACKRIGEQLGINPEPLRGWVSQAEVDGGTRAGTTTSDGQRLRELEKENRELRRANEILRTASAFFATAELDRRLSPDPPDWLGWLSVAWDEEPLLSREDRDCDVSITQHKGGTS